MQVKVLRHHRHVLLPLVHEGLGLTGGDAAKANDGASRRNWVCEQKCHFSGRANCAHAKTATRRHAQAQFIERAEFDLGIWKHHFDVGARDVLEELQIDEIIFDTRWQNAAQFSDPFLSLGFIKAFRLHHFIDARVKGLEFEQNE